MTANKTKRDAETVLLTVADIARKDQCSERTVRRAIAADVLPAIRIGPGQRAIRVTQAAHEQYRRRMFG